MPNDIDNIEIRSEEVQEILGSPPSWIVRAGISVVFSVVFILLVASWFFKYPDIITSSITLTTYNPPAQLRASNTGKITHVFVEEKQTVAKNQVIAVIENTAEYEDIMYLDNFIDTFQNVQSFDISLILQLGDVQQQYALLLRLISDFKNFEDLDSYSKNVRSLRKQIMAYNHYSKQLEAQREFKENELNLTKEQFDRSRHMFEKKIISKSDFEDTEKLYLQEKIAYENAEAAISQVHIQITQLEQQISELQLQDTQDGQSRSILITEAVDNLKSQIEIWKQNYLIRTPIEGQVTFTQIWSENQNVQIGDIVATVIPVGDMTVIGKVQIPSSGVGKVEIGQVVNIKLDNFPYMEFGMLKGGVKNISLIPTDTEIGVFYTAEIEIKDGMVSNYGKDLKFTQEMIGVAEIITDDIRLLERLFNPIRAIFIS